MNVKEAHNILQLEVGSSEDCIKSSYKKLLKKTNPEDDQKKFMGLRQAYQLALNSLLVGQSVAVAEPSRIDRNSRYYSQKIVRSFFNYIDKIGETPAINKVDWLIRTDYFNNMQNKLDLEYLYLRTLFDLEKIPFDFVFKLIQVFHWDKKLLHSPFRENPRLVGIVNGALFFKCEVPYYQEKHKLMLLRVFHVKNIALFLQDNIKYYDDIVDFNNFIKSSLEKFPDFLCGSMPIDKQRELFLSLNAHSKKLKEKKIVPSFIIKILIWFALSLFSSGMVGSLFTSSAVGTHHAKQAQVDGQR